MRSNPPWSPVRAANPKPRGPTPPTPPPGQDWNVYVNWVLYAVVGLMFEADQLAAANRHAIERVAKFIRSVRKTKLQPVYRGVVLTPQEAAGGRMRPVGDYAKVSFVSFSEDRDVACWFADPKSTMSITLTTQKGPEAAGYLIERTPNEDEVLWHYTWADRLPMPGLAGRHVADLARGHPHMAHVVGLRQSIERQKEVILRPAKDGYEVLRAVGCPPTDELDRRFQSAPIGAQNPPWSPEELERLRQELEDEGHPPGVVVQVMRGELRPPRPTAPGKIPVGREYLGGGTMSELQGPWLSANPRGFAPPWTT
jgi:hypothetical protein